MSLFKPAENSMAFAKVGFMGAAGSGKTHTATLFAIGLIKHLKERGIVDANKPAFMIDTEQGSAWVKPMFDEAGIPLMVAKTRAFKDLVAATREAEQHASVLLVDSITHFWMDLQNSYMAKKKRDHLEFADWRFIKSMWSEFSDLYVNSQLHCILCGRLGFEYETTENDRGRKQIEKSGVKMKAEGELGYEPNMLVWLERETDLGAKKVSRVANILKDRSRKLDGKQLANPTFKSFLPHVEFLSLGSRHVGVDVSRTSEDIIPRDEWKGDRTSLQRKIVIDEIEALLVEHYPSTSVADKQAKVGLVKEFLHTTSWTEVTNLMPLIDLRAGYDAMHRKLNGTASRYAADPFADIDNQKLDDEIPALAVPAMQAAE